MPWAIPAKVWRKLLNPKTCLALNDVRLTQNTANTSQPFETYFNFRGWKHVLNIITAAVSIQLCKEVKNRVIFFADNDLRNENSIITV
jgi:hypothetical protein